MSLYFPRFSKHLKINSVRQRKFIIRTQPLFHFQCRSLHPTRSVLGFPKSPTQYTTATHEKLKMSENLTPEYWQNRWSEGNIPFHSENMHKSLAKHLDKFIAGRNGIKIFFPLCGKTVDMKILADQGHYVVGVDLAEKAFKEFFTDQNLEYTEEPLKNIDGKLFKAMNGKIKLYCMDFFLFTKEMEGQFNAIWDRGSLVAINKIDRVKYSELLKECMSPDCRYMIAAIQYDESQFPGPPFNLTEKHLEDLYSNCSIEQLDENDNTEKFKDRGLNRVMEIVYLLQPKTDSNHN